MIKMKLFISFLYFLSLNCLAQVHSGVGINTSNPEATLDINGNLKIRTTDVIPVNSSGVTPLVIDNSTKEVKIVQSSSGNKFSMNYIQFNINNVNKDWVNNFNTKISTKDYTVVVVGSSFNKILVTAAPSQNDYNPFSVYAFEQDGTWRIKADYYAGFTKDGSNGSWSVRCLIINKSILKTIPPIIVDMHGSETGSVANPPSGL